jgi:hypothetical protein
LTGLYYSNWKLAYLRDAGKPGSGSTRWRRLHGALRVAPTKAMLRVNWLVDVSRALRQSPFQS